MLGRHWQHWLGHAVPVAGPDAAAIGRMSSPQQVERYRRCFRHRYRQ